MATAMTSNSRLQKGRPHTDGRRQSYTWIQGSSLCHDTMKGLIETTSLYALSDGLRWIVNGVPWGYWVFMYKIQLKFFQHLLLVELHPVYTQETLQVTMSSWVASKTLPLPKHRIHLQPRANSQQQQEATSWWQRKRAAWRLMVPQCSLLLLLHPPPSSPLSHGWRSCEKTLITVPKAAGNTIELALSCSCQTHTLTARPPTHTLQHRMETYTHSRTHTLSCCSFLFVLPVLHLSACVGAVCAAGLLLAHFQENSSHQILSAYRCGARFLSKFSY